MPDANSHFSHAGSQSRDLELDAHSFDEAVELLPWLANGSLDVDELALLDRAAEDATLQAELDATAEMLWITEQLWITKQHVPTLALAEYVLGLPATDRELSRHEIEEHLEGCAACRAEVEMIRADESESDAERPAPVVAPVVDFASARRRTARRTENPPAETRPAWRRVALAAALAMSLSAALLLQMDTATTSTDGDLTAATMASIAAPAETAEAVSDPILRTDTPDAALFSDGFESGDTGRWTTVSN